MSHLNIHRRLSCLSLLVLVLPLYACGNETVDLGGGRISQQIQSGARCADSPVVSGSVRVTSQAELAQLEGCEEIDGDLQIEVFAGADLRPLSSLRVVDGMLELGAYPEFPEGEVDDAAVQAVQAQIDAVLPDGYLPSLAGLDNLERISSLDFYYIAAEDLSALSALRELSGQEGGLQVGLVGLHDSRVRSLHGLENVEHIEHLVLSDNLELESLGGVMLDSSAGNINLIESPKLTSIAELAPVETASSLYLSNLGIENLDALTSLYFVEYAISVAGNRQLQNIDLLSEASTGSLYINDNAVLSSIPSLSNMVFLESIMAVGNPELRTIDLQLPEHGTGPYSVAGRLVIDPLNVIDIGQNDQLTTVSISAGLAETRFLALYQNPALASVTMGTLQHVESLELTANPSLVDLDLGALQTVGKLSVVDNPSLDDTPLSAVRTFETTLRGNAPTVSP